MRTRILSRVLSIFLVVILLCSMFPGIAFAVKTFDVTFAVEGLDSQVFNVTSAVNGDFTGQTAEEIAAGTKVTFTPPAQYENMPNVFRIMGMNDAFADTGDYTYKGIRIEVDGEAYAEYIPADLSELDVAEIYEIGEMVFNVTSAVNGDFTGQTAEEIAAGTKVTFTPPAQYENMPNVFRIMGMNDAFADTGDYTYKGIRIEVDGEAYAEYIPADLSELDVAEIYEIGEIELQFGNPGNGHLMFRAESCQNFDHVVLTAVYEKKQPAGSITLEFSPDSFEAAATLEYVVTAVLAAGGADQQVVEKSGITTVVTDEISFAGHENDKYTFRFGIQGITNEQYQFKGWTINGIPANDFLVSKFTVEIGDYLFITAPVSALQQLEGQKIVVVACFEKKAQSDIGTSGEFIEDTLNYRTGLSYTFEGQRTSFVSIPFEFSRKCTNVTFKAYYGDNTSGDAFYVEDIGDVNPQTIYLTAVSQAMPKVGKITLELTADGADPVTKSYSVTVKDSDETALNWLVPASSASGYPSEVKTAISGPNVYDCIAFEDPTSGELKLYFAVSGGIMQYFAGSLSSMNGVSLGYHDNEYASGYALSIGGETMDSLVALIKSDGESDTSAKYYVAYFNNGVWEKTGGSDLSGVFYPDALALTRESIWVTDKHWNGSSWVSNDVTFNSFWRLDSKTAYAGSSDGLYKYTSGEWSKVSGTSGTMFISSGFRNTDDCVTLITASEYEIERASQWHNMQGTVNKAIINGTSATLTEIDISTLKSNSYQLSNKHVYVGIANDGTIYGITDGPTYELSDFTSYYASYLFVYSNGAWVYQNVDAFNNATDKANIAAGKLLGSIETPKQQPDGIRHIENPIEGVTIFAGQGGGNYIMFSTATISFESNGGSAVEPITQTIGSAVTPPASPKRDGFTFSGWYLSDRDIAMGNAPYSWTVMPASDLTLYAKWMESSGESGDPFATEKENAKNSLATTLGRLVESDYEATVWQQIQAAYNSGIAAIAAATTYDGVYVALNGAVDEINELAKNTSGTITVAVTIEKLTVDGTYIIEPTLITMDKYERVSVAVTELLKQHYASTMPVTGGYNGNPYRITGTETSNFYLAGIYDPSFNPATAGSNGKNTLGEDFVQNHAGFLSEFDGGTDSGWLYCVNGTFPGVGASATTLVNGDVVRWQFSCTGLGSDIGADNSAWGNESHVPVANKDALIWKIAEINRDGTKAKYGEAYTDALTTLQTITATKAAVDAALAALNAVDEAEAQAAADQAAAEAVDDKIAAIGEVTLESYAEITAARSAYDALTDTQKALVTKLSDLKAAEAAYETLKAAADQAEVDAAAARSVDAMIDAIGDVSLEKEAEITDAKVAYNGLTETQKALVTKLSVLTAAEEKLAALKTDKAAAEAVDEKIAAIGTVTLESENKITEARAAYDALSAEQKAMVTKLPALAAAEEKLAELKADKTAAEAVEAKIAAIGEVKLDNENAITAARTAYKNLTDAQKALVSNLNTLTAAENKLAQLKTDKATAEAVDAKINDIGEVTLESYAAITSARSAYDALSADQKALVTKLGDLTAAETAYETLKAAADQSEVDAAAASSVDALIDSIGKVTLESEDAINAARTAYDGLTDAQKALINKLDVLEAAEEKLAELKSGSGPAEVTWQSALESVLVYLNKKVTNPSVDATEGEWVVLGLNRGGAATDAWNKIYIENLKEYVDSCEGVLDSRKYTEYSRVILALTSMGVDASAFETDKATYDLVTPLLNKQTNGAYWAEWQGNNGTAFALLAMNSHDYLDTAEGKAARAALIASLKANQMDNGAWAISGKTTPDLDVTAAGIFALAPYYLNEAKLSELGGTWTYSEVKTMVENALAYLSEKQNASGGFGSVEADVWAIIALSSIGRDADTDPAFMKNGNSLLKDMLSYRDEDTGAFRHLMNGDVDQMATEQAAYGLVAYERYKNSKNSLYDMNDVQIASLEEKAKQAEADKVDELIEAIGNVSLESKAKIDAARAAYDALTDEIKAKVSKLSDLEAAERKYKELTESASQEEIDRAAAKGVDELINSIGEVSLESESAIQAARAAYDALTDEQKALVTKSDALKAAEEKLAAMKADKAAAKTVDELIAAIGEVTKDSEEAIKAARAAYDALTEEQKKQVTKLSVLTDAENKLELLNGDSGEDDKTIRVTMRLIGAEIATKDVDLGVEAYLPNYVTWIPTTLYTLDEGATVYDLWVQATWQYGIRSIGAERNYVSTVYAPAGYALSEFSNGRRSGWMYTINGRHPGFGLVEQELHNGDTVVWHYVNDYSYEVADWYSEGQWQALGDGTYYNRWYLAPDYYGGSGGGISDSNSGSGSDNGSGSSNNNPSDSGSNVTVPVDEDIYLREDIQTAGAYATLDEKTTQEWLNSAEDKENLTIQVTGMVTDRLVFAMDAAAATDLAMTDTKVRVETPKGTFILDQELMDTLAKDGKDVRVIVETEEDGTTTLSVLAGSKPVDTTMKVELPAKATSQVLVIVNEDGTEEVIKKSVVEGGKVYAEIPAGATVKVEENKKEFGDVDDHDWFAEAVDFVSSHELFEGTGKGQFDPKAKMTRAMLVTVLYRLESEPETNGRVQFTDVDADSWYSDAVSWAAENSLVNGTGTGFDPNDNVSREQIATILYRYAKMLDLDTGSKGNLSKFGDGAGVSDWAQEAMAWAVDIGLFRGDENGNLNPGGEATRAEVATLLERLIKLIVK